MLGIIQTEERIIGSDNMNWLNRMIKKLRKQNVTQVSINKLVVDHQWIQNTLVEINKLNPNNSVAASGVSGTKYSLRNPDNYVKNGSGDDIRYSDRTDAYDSWRAFIKTDTFQERLLNRMN